MKNGLGSLRNETVLVKRLEALLHRRQLDHWDYARRPAAVVIETGDGFRPHFHRQARVFDVIGECKSGQ